MTIAIELKLRSTIIEQSVEALEMNINRSMSCGVTVNNLMRSYTELVVQCIITSLQTNKKKRKKVIISLDYHN